MNQAPAAPAPIDLEVLPGQIEGPLRFASMFGRSAPIEIEVGVGKGRFIMAQAGARPDTDFFGIEWSLKHLRIARDRAARQGIANVRFHRGDARHVLADLVPDAVVTRVHVYCPDPWPKKRHHKRRLFSPEVVPHLERILAPGGYLDVSTDVTEYFEEIVAVIGAHTGLEPASDPLFPIAGQAGNTNYEVKFLAAGRAIHRATWRRRAAGAGPAA
jgi:tRNA (guanine-N7-)-methyltransferase